MDYRILFRMQNRSFWRYKALILRICNCYLISNFEEQEKEIIFFCHIPKFQNHLQSGLWTHSRLSTFSRSKVIVSIISTHCNFLSALLSCWSAPPIEATDFPQILTRYLIWNIPSPLHCIWTASALPFKNIPTFIMSLSF